MCVALGGAFNAPLGPCTLPTTAANPASPATSPSPGSLVAKCTLISGGPGGLGKVDKCAGGAAGPSQCPKGSTIANYYHIKGQPDGTGAFTRFDCVAN